MLCIVLHCIAFLCVLCGILLYVSLDCIVHVCVCVKKTWTNLFSLLQKLTPWVGLRKINVSYWGWEDMSPFTASTLQWLPGEPSDSGFCAYLERAEVAGLKAKPCTANTEGLICEKPVGEKSFFFSPFLCNMNLEVIQRLFCGGWCSYTSNPNWIRSHRKLHRVVKKWEVWHSHSSTHPLNLIKYIWY